MFSFFKRNKSKDDSEKKDKSKEKSAYLPFNKKQDQSKVTSKSGIPSTSCKPDLQSGSYLDKTVAEAVVNIAEKMRNDNTNPSVCDSSSEGAHAGKPDEGNNQSRRRVSEEEECKQQSVTQNSEDVKTSERVSDQQNVIQNSEDVKSSDRVLYNGMNETEQHPENEHTQTPNAEHTQTKLSTLRFQFFQFASPVSNCGLSEVSNNTSVSTSAECAVTEPTEDTTLNTLPVVDFSGNNIASCSDNNTETADTANVVGDRDASKHESAVNSEIEVLQDQSDSEVAFNTAPNTPVLPKHLSLALSCEDIYIDDDTVDEINSTDNITSLDKTSLSLSEGGMEVDTKNIEIRDNEQDCSEDEASSSSASSVDNDGTVTDSTTTENDTSKSKEEEATHYSAADLYDIAEESNTEDEEVDEIIQKEVHSGDTVEEQLPEDTCKRNLVNQGTKFQEQVGELTAELEAREVESNKLHYQIDELQRDVCSKSSGMDRLQAELMAAHKESELVKKKLRKVEEDLDDFKQKNSELAEELLKRTDDINGENSARNNSQILDMEEKIKELCERVKDLESQLEKVRQERDKLELEAQEMEAEREEERKIVQEALDEAMAEKDAIQERFEKEFEKLRTVNTDREQQLLDDFEWKLREVEQVCKKRLEEKDQITKQKIKEVEDKLKAVEKDLTQLEVLKQYEAEAKQLRGVNAEQQRALRVSCKTTEQLQTSEKLLNEEVQRLRTAYEKEKETLTTVQAIHNREIAEKDRKMLFKLEQQKNEINSQWEEKLRKDAIRLKSELELLHRDEKKNVLEALRQEKDEELKQIKMKWDKQHQNILSEVESLKQKLNQKDSDHKRELEMAQTNADRDIFDLRRKVDKIHMSYSEQIEKLEEAHAHEIERIKEEYEKKLQQCEQNWQLQLGSTRTTLELVKEQLHRETQDQLQALSDKHREQLEEQWNQLMQERDETVAMMEQKHKANTEKLRQELDSIYKAQNSRENELLETLTKLRQELAGKSSMIGDLQSNVDTLQNNVDLLNQEVTNHKEEADRQRTESSEKLRLRESELQEELTKRLAEVQTQQKKEIIQWQTTTDNLQKKIAVMSKQLEESKPAAENVKLINDLRRSLHEKDQQIARLCKEKHLYQLELMNRESAAAKQRKKGGNKPPPPKQPGRGGHHQTNTNSAQKQQHKS